MARGTGGTEDGRLVTQVLDRCIEQGAAAIQWMRRTAEPGGSRDSARARGIGIALTERSGGGGQGAATVKVHLDGSVIVFFASTDIGQGTGTDDPDDRRRDPRRPACDGARGRRRHRSERPTTLAASATGPFREPAGLRRPPRARLSGTDPCLRGPALRQRGSHGSGVARRCRPAQGTAREGRHAPGADATPGAQASSAKPPRFNRRPGRTSNGRRRRTSSRSKSIAKPERCGCSRYIAAHDLGRPVNLTIVQNQIEGGVIQGLALTQAEEMRFDPRNGRCLNANFLDLKPPTALDFDPRVIEAIVVDNMGEVGPFGAKGTWREPDAPGDGCCRQCDSSTPSVFDCDGCPSLARPSCRRWMNRARRRLERYESRRSAAVKNFGYSRPSTLREASALLGNEHGKVALLAGGTDLLGEMKDNLAVPEQLIYIKHLKELQGIRRDRTGVRIGAAHPARRHRREHDRAATGTASRHGGRQDRHAADTEHGDYRRECLSATTLLVLPQQLPVLQAWRHDMFLGRWRERFSRDPRRRSLVSSCTPRTPPRRSSRSGPSRTSPGVQRIASCRSTSSSSPPSRTHSARTCCSQARFLRRSKCRTRRSGRRRLTSRRWCGRPGTSRSAASPPW